MAHSHGQRAWARARLTRGSSTGEVWEIGSEYPEARLSVGADASVGWLIQAPGVQPVHCELFWDGQSLWVADTYGAGGVFLDGARVGEWVQIHGPAELRFGQAALDVETSAPAHEAMASSPRDARPVTVTDMVMPERRSQPIFGGAAGDDSIPEIEAAATRVVASAAEVEAQRARVAPSQGAAASVEALRPRLGGAPAAHAAEATRMVPMPAKAGPPPPPPPAHPALAPAPVVAPPPPPVAPSFGQPPGFAPTPPPPPELPPVPDPAVAPLAPGSMDSGGAFVGPPADAHPAGPKKSPVAQILEKLKPQSSAEVLAASGGKKGQTIPTRTWIMLGVTLVAAVGLLLWEDEPAEVAAPQQQASAQGGAVAVPPTPAQPTPTPTPTPTAAPTPTPTPAPEQVAVAPTPAPTPSETPAGESEAPVGPSLQRQAADHVIHGRFREALTIYRQLAHESPDDAAYAAMVRILERRVECVNGLGPGGQPCGS